MFRRPYGYWSNQHNRTAPYNNHRQPAQEAHVCQPCALQKHAVGAWHAHDPRVEKVKEYAVAAQALGSAQARLVFRHLLPNSLAPIITQSTTNMSWAILNAAGLSFLGVGLQPPMPEWGVMISEGSAYIVSGQWWMSFFPGAALVLMTAGFTLLGDGLNACTER